MKILSLAQFETYWYNNCCRSILFESNWHGEGCCQLDIACRFCCVSFNVEERFIEFSSSNSIIRINSVLRVEIGDVVENYYQRIKLVCYNAHDLCDVKYDLMLTY